MTVTRHRTTEEIAAGLEAAFNRGFIEGYGKVAEYANFQPVGHVHMPPLPRDRDLTFDAPLDPSRAEALPGVEMKFTGDSTVRGNDIWLHGYVSGRTAKGPYRFYAVIFFKVEEGRLTDSVVLRDQEIEEQLGLVEA
jgi:hypothetical protein